MTALTTPLPETARAALRHLTGQYLDWLSANEPRFVLPVMCDLKDFVDAALELDTDEALAIYLDNAPMFGEYMRYCAMQAQAAVAAADEARERFDRAVARSNVGVDSPRSRWEAQSYALHAGKEHKVALPKKLSKPAQRVLAEMVGGECLLKDMGNGNTVYIRERRTTRNILESLLEAGYVEYDGLMSRTRAWDVRVTGQRYLTKRARTTPYYGYRLTEAGRTALDAAEGR